MAFASKVLICPKCLRKKIFIKDFKEDTFRYDSQHDPYYEFGGELEVATEMDFHNHIAKCKSPFPKKGVKIANSDLLKNIALNLNSISSMETGYNKMSIQESTFFYAVDGLAVSYITFDPQFVKEDPSSWILKDIYTILKHRKKGYSSKLFEYAIKKLNLDLQNLWISFPISGLGKHIVLKYAQNKIMAVAPVYPGTYDVNDLKENWEDIMKLY
nr:hypothetical protein [uncultured Methanoregula sp.]